MSDGKAIAGAVQKYFAIFKVPHDEPTKDFLSRCKSDAIKVNNNTYKYYRQGNGPTIVLVHGLHSNLGSMVPMAHDLIDAGYGVVLFDAPAHGEAAGTQTTPLEAREVIRKIGSQLGDIHAIVCHSLGGLWALSAWHDDFRARTLVSIASPANHRFLVEKFVALQQIDSEVAEGLIKQLERRFGERLWIDFSPSEIVKTIGVPGLIVHGTDDEFVPPAHAEQLHAHWPDSKVEMIEGGRHFDIAGTAQVRKLVAAYLRQFEQASVPALQ